MADRTLVSAIIPTFNRAAMAVAAIRSVFAQTYKPLECIVVDDGSADDTSSLLEKEFANKIKLIRQENRGVSAARNAGIKAANGCFIAFLDSDDTWLPEKTEKQTAWFAGHPDGLICQTTERWIRKGKRVNPPKTHLKKEGRIFFESLERCMVTPSSVMLKRQLLEESGLFDESMPVCEDYDLWLRITCRHPVGLVREDLLVRNGGRPDQLSANHSMDKYRIRALAKILESGMLDGRQRSEAHEMLKKRCTIYINGCLKRHRQDEADACREILASVERKA
jgi:glycosyltransferase involved in cell wall biosynthesis